jgi:palmitoyl transferase
MDFKNACTQINRLQITASGLLACILILFSSLITTHVDAATMDASSHMIVNGRSYHMQQPRSGKKLNENNYGTGYQYEFARSYGAKWVPFISGSAFSDSFNNLSYYVGAGESRRFYLTRGWHFDIGYFGFLMARKDINDYQPFPGVLPVASLGTNKISLNMTYIPKVNDQVAELIFFQLKVSMDN